MSTEALLTPSNPKAKSELKGKIYFIAGISLQGVGFLTGKLLYESYADLNPCVFLVYRACLSVALLGLYHNTRFFSLMAVTRDQIKPLAIRVLSGNFSIFVNFSAVKYFSLSLVAMVTNTAPLMTFFFALIFFGEKVTRKQVVLLFLSFLAVIFMIQGQGTDPEKRPEYTPNLIMFILLLFAPVSASLSQVAMKAM